MSGMKDVIAEAIALPVEERALIVDSLLRSLNRPLPEIDQLWIAEAQRRLKELRSGNTRTVSGPEVFEKVNNLFRK